MNAQLQQFSFEKDGLLTDVRVHVDEKGDPWFCAQDVCFVLGYKNPRDAIAKHCSEHGVKKLTTAQQRDVAKRDATFENEVCDVAFRDASSSARHSHEMSFINEGNLYRLTIKSRLPAAKQFEAFVCDTVLPSIRKHGYFQLRDMSAPVRQVIDLQKHALDLFTKLKKETDADSREYLYSLLQSVSSLLNQPAPPITSIGKTLVTPTEHPLIAKFFERIALLEAKGYQLNHSRNHLVAINLPQFINLCAEEKLPTIASNEWKEALRTSERFVGVRTVNSGIKSQAVRCWLFTAEVSA